jgi:hypothetical protein
MIIMESDMVEEIYMRILRMRALDRWENEGGQITDDQFTTKREGETKREGDNLFGLDHQDVRQTAQ